MGFQRTSRSNAKPCGDRSKILVLDLFAGAGGLTEGFYCANSRFKTIQAVESDLTAAATYANNHGDVVHVGQIQHWLRHQDVPEVDVIVGGPPCQGFSALGKGDVEDARNVLWKQYAEAVRLARPKYFVLENVAAFLHSPQIDAFRRRATGRGALRDYTFEARVLNAADYGAPQARKRTVLIGHRRDVPSPGFPEPTRRRDGWTTLKEALLGLPERVDNTKLPALSTTFREQELPGAFVGRELHLGRYYEAKSLARFKSIPPGGNRFDIPDELLSPCWRKHTSGSADVMGRLDWDKPSVTIRTEFFKPEKGRYLHPTQHRALTHLEAARLQGFPDEYLWVGSKTSIARQIGNAVPIPLASALGTLISSQF